MPFEGLGQSLYDDAKKIVRITTCIELVESGDMSIENALSFLNISKEDFDIATAQIKLFNKNDKNVEYRQWMHFRSKYQDILGKMDE